ncbi:flavodoxin family protein [Pontiella agarivorans]|uniref:Flavodoxin family protein n=1 Tax=Pontiella agarivorans TaxID=3038953 RepID=A0ABU5MVF0_9BACT|nr:flavodoxin family protein [Pontiella agarivorans]MDZ8118193.1 flavodoxin family protein [Pontiella agarivorans]
MKVVAINGSPRKGGNTEALLKRVCERLNTHGIETEIIKIGGELLSGCTACGACFKTKNKRCIIYNDPMNEWMEKMFEADGILLGSPTYFSDVTMEMKALIDRLGYVAIANDQALANKVGAAVTVARRAGAQHTLNTMNHLFSILQMPIATSSYWNIGYGAASGEAEHDVEGLQTMDNLAENMAWLMKSIEAGKGTVPPPNIDRSQQMNFIRLEAESE